VTDALGVGARLPFVTQGLRQILFALSESALGFFPALDLLLEELGLLPEQRHGARLVDFTRHG
jgi:hypothetical protein